MFRPIDMRLVKIFFLKEDLEVVSQKLYDFGFIEIERAQNFVSEEKANYLDTQELLTKCIQVKESIKNILCNLGINNFKKNNCSLIISLKFVYQIEHQVKEIEKEVNSTLHKLQEYQKRVQELEFLSRVLNAIEDMGLDLDHFRDIKNLVVKIGLIPVEFAKDITNILKDFIIEFKDNFKDEIFIFCVGLKEKEEYLIKTLRALRFKEINLPSYKSLSEALDEIELNLWALREEIANLRAKLKDIRNKFKEKLLSYLFSLEENERLYNTMNKFLASRLGYIIVGWVPENKIKELASSINNFSQAEIQIETAEDMIKKGLKYQEIPSYIDHKLFKPFERLVKFYGIPAYKHVDPTIFMALSFLIMFGIMFADLGHGLILSLMGAFSILFRRLRDFGKILFSAGLSSAVFGILFGSCFGREDIIEALWFYPFREPQKFLNVGIVIGVIMVSLGIFLNILQKIWQRDLKEILFNEWGVFSIIFYWLSLYFLVSALRFKTVNLNTLSIVLILSVPLLLITFGDLLIERKIKDLSLLVSKPVEVVLGLLANTVSFVRVAAFGLTHAALGASVYLVAENFSKLAGLKESLIVEGNIGIIILEGVIVFIQSLRLEFYEFFSKFFHLEGREFKPLKERR